MIIYNADDVIFLYPRWKSEKAGEGERKRKERVHGEEIWPSPVVCFWPSAGGFLAENQARVEVETGETLKHVSGVQCVNTAAETGKKKKARGNAAQQHWLMPLF